MLYLHNSLKYIILIASIVIFLAFQSSDAFAITEDFKFIADDTKTIEQFGGFISISGDTAIVSSTFDDHAGVQSGSAYIFEFDGTNWNQVAKLTASDAAPGDRFATSISISGNTAIVGAIYNDDAGSNSGSAYIFEKPSTGWVSTTEVAKLTASDAGSTDLFGHSVSIYDDKVIVGASSKSYGVGFDAGAAYIFEKPSTGWVSTTEDVRLTPIDAAHADRFGFSVSMFGDSVLVTAPFNDDTFSNSGSAYIFEFDGTNWNQVAKLTASDVAFDDQFGFPYATMYGDTAAIGAINNLSTANTGFVYIFEKPLSGWIDKTEDEKLIPMDAEDGDQFSKSISIYDDKILVASRQDDHTGFSSGSAYIFGFNGTNWVETTKLIASDAALDDYFGNSVSIYEDKILIGAPLRDESGPDSGVVYSFGLVPPDTTPPVITLNGMTPVTLESGVDTYSELGAIVTDDDPAYSETVTVGGDTVDANTVGVYVVTYDAPSDDAGNIPVQVTRTVNVVDTTSPVITLIGNTTVELLLGDSYVDAGATASDNVDGDITINIVTGVLPIDTNIIGPNTVTYDVTDAAGNAAIQVTRNVDVISSIEAIENIQDAVDVLGLPQGPLKNILKHLTDNNLNNDQATCGKLTKFIADIEEFIVNGDITPEEGQALIDAANTIKINLGIC